MITVLYSKSNACPRSRLGIQKPKSFTLIELLVVVAIIAVLISILLPALSQARKNAKALVCSSRERSIGQAIHAYANDNQDYFPMATAGMTANNYQYPTWIHRLNTPIKYLGVQYDGTYWRFAAGDPAAWNCPELKGNDVGSYRCNGMDWTPSGSSTQCLMKYNNPVDHRAQDIQIPRTRIENPSSIFIVLEKMPYDSINDGDYYPDIYAHLLIMQNTQNQKGARAVGIYNHLGGTNILFVDGHVGRWQAQKVLLSFVDPKNKWYPSP